MDNVNRFLNKFIYVTGKTVRFITFFVSFMYIFFYVFVFKKIIMGYFKVKEGGLDSAFLYYMSFAAGELIIVLVIGIIAKIIVMNTKSSYNTKCNFCRHENRPSSIFCSKCGNKLDSLGDDKIG